MAHVIGPDPQGEHRHGLPDLLPGLLAHPGVGLVVVDSERDGPVALGRDGEHHLVSGRIVGDDPVAAFGPRAADGLRRIHGFSNTGDLIVIGPYDPDTGEIVSYEDLVGSHGGLGGWQGEPFLLHPTDLPIGDEPLVGAPAVHAQLRLWLDSLQRGVLPTDDGPKDAVTETDPPEPPETDPPEPPETPEIRDRKRREPVGANAATELPAS